MNKHWQIKHQNPHLQTVLSNALNIHPIIAQLLINRNIITIQEAKNFFETSLSSLHDPFELKHMDRVVERLEKAQRHKERILIFGDYDVDGVTSSALLYRALTQRGLKVINHIPHRVHDGYGLNEKIVKFVKDQEIGLLVSLDSGISAYRAVEQLNQIGTEVMIIDHHEPSHERLPGAYAIVNPKQKDCRYPFKNLASCGLVAKLIHALNGHVPEEIFDLVALGTIADVVPLRGENRIFVRKGLPRIRDTKNKGLAALMRVAKMKPQKINPYHVGFILGPRINATGRMDSAHKSLDLFLCEDEKQADMLARQLDELNSQRQRVQKEIVDQALDIAEREINFKEQKVIVLSKENWHKGVLGIVASKITEKYYRPTIVISLKEGIGTASARSIEGFHLYNALHDCSGLLENYGGHEGAAGLTIRAENIDPFKELINQVAGRMIPIKQLTPRINIDCEIPLASINLTMAETIASMEPFGEGNPEPTFCSRRVTVKSYPAILGKETLKFWVTDGQITLCTLGFGMAEYKPLIVPGQLVDLAYQIMLDDWNKEASVILKLKDMRGS